MAPPGLSWTSCLSLSLRRRRPMASSPCSARSRVFVGRNRLDYLVELANESTVRSLHPDLKQIAALSNAEDARGVIVTAAGANSNADVVSRCFYPSFRIDEDPVTGSAHCGACTLLDSTPRQAGDCCVPGFCARRLAASSHRRGSRACVVSTLRGELPLWRKLKTRVQVEDSLLSQAS